MALFFIIHSSTLDDYKELFQKANDSLTLFITRITVFCAVSLLNGFLMIISKSAFVLIRNMKLVISSQHLH